MVKPFEIIIWMKSKGKVGKEGKFSVLPSVLVPLRRIGVNLSYGNILV
jgi:hypothetical protein